ncbi:hypothetical protein BH10PSE13_BH10PSE13_04290 [soil metagenome]
MADDFREDFLSRRRALGCLGVGLMGGFVSAWAAVSRDTSGAGVTGNGKSLVTIPKATPTPTPTPTATSTTVKGNDRSLKLHELAARRGILFGTPYPALSYLQIPGPAGVGTLADFMRDQAALYVNVGMIPQTVEWTAGWYNLAPLLATIGLATTASKAWRGNCLLYPLADSASVKATVSASNWREMMTRHFEAIAAAPGAQGCTSLDVTNEVLDPTNMAVTDGYRSNHWLTAAGPDYLVHAYKEARRLWPTTPLYWCHDQTEQLTDSWHQNMATVNLRAIERAMNAGAPIDGYNMQSHLTIRLGLDEVRLRSFLDDITKNLGLKVMIGELDCRTGYRSPNFVDTPPPESYTTDQLDTISADLVERFLNVTLPYVQNSGKQLVCWGLSDIYDPWSTNNNPAERPMPWDKAYQPKLMWSAIQRSLMRLPLV